MGRFINESEFIAYKPLKEADDDFGLNDDDEVADDSVPKAASSDKESDSDTPPDDSGKSTPADGSSDDDGTSTDDDSSLDGDSMGTPADPNSEISIFKDLKSRRMLKIYKDLYNMYDVFTDTQSALNQLLKRPDFYVTAVKLNNELIVVLHELKIVLDSDFDQVKESVYQNVLTKFQAYARYLMEIIKDIENKI